MSALDYQVIVVIMVLVFAGIVTLLGRCVR